MKKIMTIAAVAALATLTACGTETVEVPADENVAVVATEDASAATVREEVKIDKQKNPNEQIP